MTVDYSGRRGQVRRDRAADVKKQTTVIPNADIFDRACESPIERILVAHLFSRGLRHELHEQSEALDVARPVMEKSRYPKAILWP